VTARAPCTVARACLAGREDSRDSRIDLSAGLRRGRVVMLMPEPVESSIIAVERIMPMGWRCPVRRCRVPSHARAETAHGHHRYRQRGNAEAADHGSPEVRSDVAEHVLSHDDVRVTGLQTCLAYTSADSGPGHPVRCQLVHFLCAVSETRSLTSRRAENYVRSASEAIQPGGWYVLTGASGVPA
jgi:hypothetical protein